MLAFAAPHLVICVFVMSKAPDDATNRVRVIYNCVRFRPADYIALDCDVADLCVFH